MKLLFSSFALLVATFIQAQNLPTSATDTDPLLNGQEVPSAQLFDLDGNAIEVSELISAQPTMFLFYRGSWCPYCNRQLAGLQEVEPQIREMGFQIVAISPDKPESMQKTVDKNELTYTVVSDHTIDFMNKMGLAYVDHKGRTLPVPAVYLVDTEGIVQFSYVNPNYKVRPHPELLLKAAELMVRE